MIARFSHDDGLRLWLNGEKVYEDGRSQASVLDAKRATLKLDKGWNQLLCQVWNRQQLWRFQLRFVDRESGAAADGIVVAHDRDPPTAGETAE